MVGSQHGKLYLFYVYSCMWYKLPERPPGEHQLFPDTYKWVKPDHSSYAKSYPKKNDYQIKINALHICLENKVWINNKNKFDK